MADSECTRYELALIPCQKHRKLDGDLEFNLFSKLCDELVGEILVRLPTTAAVRFKVVCKRWYSLISSPSFIARFIQIRHHRDRDVESSIVFQFAYHCDGSCISGGCGKYHYEFQIISNDTCLLRNVYGDGGFSLSYLPRDRHLVLEGSSADLILCSSNFETNYYVINLLTRQWIALPPPPPPPFEDKEDLSQAVSIGFLCSECKPPHHKFMVVRLCSAECIPHFEVQLFSSEDDYKWRTLVVSSSLPLPFLPDIVDSPLVAYRGMLHWLNTDGIVVYDPLNTPNTLSRIIPLPFQLPAFIHSNSCFGVSQGRLRVVELSDDDVDDDHILDVWELEDYDSELWNLVYNVHLENLIPNGLPESLHTDVSCFLALSLHPENGDVIYLRILNGIVLLNMKSRIIEAYYPTKKDAVFNWTNAFSLADQWWPTSLSSFH